MLSEMVSIKELRKWLMQTSVLSGHLPLGYSCYRIKSLKSDQYIQFELRQLYTHCRRLRLINHMMVFGPI